jgi:hypothetical protein
MDYMNTIYQPGPVFISYDGRDFNEARALNNELTKAKIEVIFDGESVHPGDDFVRFMNSMAKCTIVIYIISKNSLENERWQQAELHLGTVLNVEKGTRLIPYIIDNSIKKGMLPIGLISKSPLYKCEDYTFIVNQIKQIVSGTGSDSQFDETDRRIRVQITTECNRKGPEKCSWCHWDEFDKSVDTPDPDRVIEILKQLSSFNNLCSKHPLPRLEYTLTGGEPLLDAENFKKFAKICPENSYVVTNGDLLGPRFEAIRDSKIRNIRVSNLFDVESTRINRNKLEGLVRILKLPGIKIRLNQILLCNKSDSTFWINQIDSIITTLINNPQLSQHIGANGSYISGVAFVEPSYAYHDVQSIQQGLNKSIDLFEVSDAWAKHHDIGLPDSNQKGFRKRSYQYSPLANKNLNIEFIKINCDVKDDYILRCLYCVVEKDICLAADGRIRICSGWDLHKNTSPIPTYAYISESNPSEGIAAAIRKQYANVGFFSHIPIFTQIGPQSTEVYPFAYDTDFQNAIYSFPGGPRPGEIANNCLHYLQKICTELFVTGTLYCRLFEEGLYSKQVHENSIKLCAQIIRICNLLSLKLSKDPNNHELKNELMLSILLLEYLTVDEQMFTSSRSYIAHDLSRFLLDNYSKNKFEVDILICDALFAISAIALENIDGETVKRFLSLFLSEDERDRPQIQYIYGCIERQIPNKNNEASKIFSNISSLIEAGGLSFSEKHTTIPGLFPDLLIESERSRGAALKGVNNPESSLAFYKADFLSLTQKSKLRFHILYSFGYSSMRNYFISSDYTLKEKERLAALRNLEESIRYEPEFYASLIRLGIMYLELNLKLEAKKYFEQARTTFSKKGLLTNQEFLNSVLCEISFCYANSLPINEHLASDISKNMIKCKTIGKADVECVKRDAEIVEKIATGWPFSVHIKTYIENCNFLLTR